jgi:hypothetical protein
MATKTQLVTTTAHTPAASAPAPKVTALKFPSDYMTEAKRAFHDRGTAADLNDSARQRLAYAIQCHAAKLMADGTCAFTLTQALTVTDAKDALLAHMKDTFLAPANDKADGIDDKSTTEDKTRTANASLLSRAFLLACVLSARNITFQAFIAKSGNYMVPSSSLVSKDHKAFGRLAGTDRVMLDNRGIVMTGKNKKGNDTIVQALASVAQFVRVNGPTPKQRTPRTADKNDKTVGMGELLGKVKPEDMANHADGATLVYAVFTQFVTDGNGDQCHRSDYDDKVWTMLNQISAWTLEVQAAPGWDDKTPAKNKGRRVA